MITQRDGRELALKFLFCQEFLSTEDLDLPVPNRIVRFQSSFKAPSPTWNMMRQIVTQYFIHKNKINEHILSSLEKWKMERLSLTDKNILRIALTEALHLELPPKVALSEALKLGEKYSTQDSSSFINGLLDHSFTKLGLLK